MSSKKWIALLNNAATLVCQRCRLLNAVAGAFKPSGRRSQAPQPSPAQAFARLDQLEQRQLMSSTLTDFALVGQSGVTVGFQSQVSGGGHQPADHVELTGGDRGAA